MTRAATALVLLLLLVSPAHAELWTGVLDPSRAITWSNAGIAGGIPTRTTICSTLNPGATAAQINAAIAVCPAGQVVFLNAGTYSLAAGIDFNNTRNVTLRGAGPTQTIITFSAGVTCGGLGANVCFRNGQLNHVDAVGNLANWTAGYTAGTTALTVSSTTNLQVGTVVILDQLNDGDTDTGNVWVNNTLNVSSNDGPSGGGRTGRYQQQLVKVTNISGSTVTVTPGLYMPNWRSGQTPQAWWSNDTPISSSGIENLSLNYAGNTSSSSGIYFYNAYNCWVKNVRSLNAKRNHVWFFQSARNVVRDSYLYESQSHASESYGVESYLSSDNLVENNIVDRVTSPFIANGSASGTVVGYNYSTNDTYTPSATWMQPSAAHHSTGVNMVLHEGNEGSGLQADNVHGPAAFVTAFRNQWTGWETGKSQQTVPVHLYDFSRYFNIVGNVLGRAGHHSLYTSQAGGSSASCDTAIFALGWGGNCSSGSAPPNDTVVATTILRWGNYDVVNNGVRFVAGENASAAPTYPGLANPSQTLPASFYLAAKPTAWWTTAFGTPPWPAIGPDVTGGNVTSGSGAASTLGGHAWKIPARLCAENTALDGANPYLAFNASACYFAAPSTPGNVRVTSSGLGTRSGTRQVQP